MNRDKAFAKGDKQKFTSLRNKVRDEIKKEKQKFYRIKVKPLQFKQPKRFVEKYQTYMWNKQEQENQPYQPRLW
jgi:hypothetical protein